MTRRDTAAAALLFAAVAAALVGLLSPTGATHVLTDDFQAGPGRSDAYTFLWGHWWVHQALAAGKSLFHCDRVFPPEGADVRFHSILWVPAVLSWPLAAVFGEVRAYNATITALLAGAAFAMHLSLSITFRLRFAVAALFGALFGFAPYFVFKAHVHPNLAGAALWAPALALLLHVILRVGRARHGAAFALFFWLCFWTSLVEGVMLTVAAAVLLAAAAVLRGVVPAARGELHLPLAWLWPACLGLPTLASLLVAPGEGLERELFPAPGAEVWLGFPLLSLFAGAAHGGRLFEYGGTGIPIGLSLLAAAGAFRGSAGTTRALLVSVFAGLVVLTADPFGLPSAALRALPLGEAVRVFARFFPFALFFAVILAAHAAERALSSGAGLARWLIAGAVLLAVLETWPRAVHRSSAVSLAVPAEVRAALDPDGVVLVLPLAPRDYPRRREAYQVELGLPFVHMGHLTREDPQAVRRREEAFPLFYSASPQAMKGLTPEGLNAELDRLGVRYLLYDRPEQARQFPLSGDVVHRTAGEVLLRR
jgi:hypothetical protein